ncbi:MAG: cupin domain-containing protein [Neobacillus sp.]
MIAAEKNRTIENPLIGDRVTFITTKKESGGKYELVEVHLKGGGGNGLHYHTTYREEFEAVTGHLYIDCDDKTYILKPGDKLAAHPKSNHRFYNPGDTPIAFRVKIIPARSFEPMLRIAYGLARDKRVNDHGIPKNILEMAVMFQIGESYLPKIPLNLQKGIFGFLYQLAKWFGVEKRLYEKYVWITNEGVL